MSTNPDYSLLTTIAECDDAEAAVTLELETFDHRDRGYTLADKRADASQAAGSATLAKKDEEIAQAQYKAAAPGLAGQAKQDADDLVELLQAQRKKIVRDNRADTGLGRFKITVDAAQAENQTTLLSSIRDGVRARRDELRRA
ncbi:hypothetical protein EJV47_24880 [Hymenobacter gummosus]|uniref:Uncharacterized protein n=1 Tax=Hymenobacter gummosus TaxID=1776032 RepID=A0A3S0HJP6_9BACT|nr:hypothetical protein [Hymenobacter gummosus]RTQ45724.1 hypothetical protein EJV47_24880 [Hymenobacter gummosus]